MRAIIQRVGYAGVSIDGKTQSEIKKGFLILLGVSTADTEDDAKYLAEKCSGLRVFEDENGKMNLSLEDISGEMLIVSNFTLMADCTRGRRPGFENAARPEKAIPLYELFCSEAGKTGIPVKTGVFGADMKISLQNDGPVTLILDTDMMRCKK